MNDGDSSAKTRAGKVRLPTLRDMDARTAAYRRFKELAEAYASDIGGSPTTAENAIIQRIVSLQVWLESADVTFAGTGDLDIVTYTTVTNSFRRLLADLGLGPDSDPPELLKAKKIHKAIKTELRTSN